MQTCDENLKIIHINARFPGSTHDAYIWRESNLSGIMEDIYRRFPGNNFFLVGDSGTSVYLNFFKNYNVLKQNVMLQVVFTSPLKRH